MQPLGTKVYLLKRYSPSDGFCTFFFWECTTLRLKKKILKLALEAIKSWFRAVGLKSQYLNEDTLTW